MIAIFERKNISKIQILGMITWSLLAGWNFLSFCWDPSSIINCYKLYLAITCKKFHRGKAGSLFCTAGIPLSWDKIFPVIASAKAN